MRYLVVASTLALAGSAVVFACSSFGGSAEPPVEGGLASETSVETSVVDAARPSDAGAAPGFCTTSDAAFCADFDDGGFAGEWTAFSDSGASSVTLDSMLALSAPSSMHLRIEGAAIAGATQCDYARPHRRFTELVNKKHANLAFDIWVGPADASVSPVVIASIASIATGTGCQFIVGLGTRDCSTRFEYPDAAAIQAVQTSAVFGKPLGRRWTRVELRLSLDPASSTATFLVDGQLCSPPTSIPTVCLAPATFDIFPGLYCVKASDGIVEANLDNIEFRVE